jgi:hypothetical protein
MSMFKPKVSLNVLPQDALLLKDEQFYSLVEKLTSSDISLILKCQFINSINTFLLCKNILAPILLPTSTFEAIRRDICVKLNPNHNSSYVIHVGIVGQVEYLTELFQKKHLQDAKKAPKHRSPAARLASDPSSLSTPASNHAVTVIPSSATITSTPVFPLTVDYRSNIISSINKWISGQKILNGSNTLHLVEGKDYTLQLSSSGDIASVVCHCDTRVSLPKSTDNTFFLSNLYKHWKGSKKCNVLTPTLSIPSLPISLSLDDSDTDSSEDNDNTLSSSLSTQPNTRTRKKRNASSNQSTVDTTSNKRQRYK